MYVHVFQLQINTFGNYFHSVSSEGLEAAQMLRHFVDLTNEVGDL